jgi:hypothetical protein
VAETKNVLLTFDYELFQGTRSGTVANCMLKPTDKILDVLGRHKAISIFFIDMMYVVRLHEAAGKYPKAKGDFELIEKQIIRMAEEGHYVFNHLHPHWLNALYNDGTNQWQLTDTSKYAFSSLTVQQQTGVFEASMKLLNEILAKAKRKFPADGFRAGGLYIQPFTAFKNHFDKHGIKYDFSVLVGATGSLENKSGSFDFSGIKKSIYSFWNDITIENATGEYKEYALQIAYIPFSFRLLNSVFYRTNKNKSNHQKYGDGVSTHNKINFPSLVPLGSSETFSIEMLNAIKLPVYLSELNRTRYLHVLSHPKLVSDYNIDAMDILLKKITASGTVEFDFKKFSLPA